MYDLESSLFEKGKVETQHYLWKKKIAV